MMADGNPRRPVYTLRTLLRDAALLPLRRQCQQPTPRRLPHLPTANFQAQHSLRSLFGLDRSGHHRRQTTVRRNLLQHHSLSDRPLPHAVHRPHVPAVGDSREAPQTRDRHPPRGAEIGSVGAGLGVRWPPPMSWRICGSSSAHSKLSCGHCGARTSCSVVLSSLTHGASLVRTTPQWPQQPQAHQRWFFRRSPPHRPPPRQSGTAAPSLAPADTAPDAPMTVDRTLGPHQRESGDTPDGKRPPRAARALEVNDTDDV